MFIRIFQTVSVRTHLRACTSAGGAICVQMEVGNLSKMCMRLGVRVTSYLGLDK